MGHKSFPKDEVRQLKETIRELKKVVRSLQKENSALKRDIQIFDSFIDIVEAKQERRQKIVEKKIVYCEHCGKGEQVQITVGKYLLISCTVCDHKKRIENN